MTCRIEILFLAASWNHYVFEFCGVGVGSTFKSSLTPCKCTVAQAYLAVEERELRAKAASVHSLDGSSCCDVTRKQYDYWDW